ncbi:MAG: diguanylate cyclase [Magnetococcales bacterium]|nr:diguanylate cyclase [Magnetococcales bacterium]
MSEQQIPDANRFQSMMLFWRTLRLDLKIGFVSMVVMSIILVLFHWDSRNSVQNRFWLQWNQYAQSLADLTAIFVAQPLMDNNTAVLKSLSDRFPASHNQVTSVRLLNQSGAMEIQTERTSNSQKTSDTQYFFAKIHSPVNPTESIGSVVLGLTTSEAQSVIASQMEALTWDMLLALLTLLLAVNIVFNRIVRKPVHLLEQQTASLMDGDLTHPISLESRDELGNLAQSLDLMRTRLLESHTMLADRNKSLEKLSGVLENQVQERTRALSESYLLLEQELTRRQEAHAKLREVQHQTELILSTVGEGIFGVDLNGNMTFVNAAAVQMLGWSQEEMLGQNSHELLHHTHQNGLPHPIQTCQVCTSIREKKTRKATNEVFWRKDGASFPIEYASSPLFDGDDVTGAVVVFRDVTDRKIEEERSLHSQISRIAVSALLETGLEDLTLVRQLEVALDIILAVSWLSILAEGSIFLTDLDTGELVMAAQRNLAKPLLDSCGRIPIGRCLCGRAAETRQIVFVNHIDEHHEIAYSGMKPHGHYCVPILSKGKLLGVLNLYIPDGYPRNPEEDAFLTTIANTLAGIIERRQIEEHLRNAEEKLRQKAHHDPLTGLPNRLFFQELLQRSLAQVRREGRSLAVLFMDLDHFKQVNDTMGHEAGDQLLVEVAKRICSCLREGDTVARLGGDEFTLILQEPSRRDDIVRVVERIIEQIRKPVLIKGQPCHVGASIGISLHPEHGRDPVTLLKKADQAMYQAKDHNRNGFIFYEPNATGEEASID